MTAPLPKDQQQIMTVVGGSGFMGSHVADVLSDLGHHVRVFDRATSPWLRPDQEMIIGDIGDQDQLDKACAGASVVFHYAGIADIGAANVDPVRTAQINLMGTINVLNAARKANVKRFMFASTVYVYSEMGGFYRASKQACESFIETYRQEYGLNFTILRYGTLYGRRAGETNRIHAMIRSAIVNRRIEYPGSGEAQRDFIHVQDAAKLTALCIAEAYANRHLLITGQERMRVRDIAAMIAEIMDEHVALDFAEGEPEGHYMMTPYAFSPRLSHKLVPSDYIDLGQGILDCIEEQWNAHFQPKQVYVPGAGQANARIKQPKE